VDASPTRHDRRLQASALAAALLLLLQAALGMVVNLFVTIPAHHPGARASDYVGGSIESVGWAIGHGAGALVAHVLLGLLIGLFSLHVVAVCARSGQRATVAWSALAALLVVAAGFNGASFLDYGHNVNSLIMALLALGAVGCYATVLYLTGRSAAAAQLAPPRR